MTLRNDILRDFPSFQALRRVLGVLSVTAALALAGCGASGSDETPTFLGGETPVETDDGGPTLAGADGAGSREPVAPGSLEESLQRLGIDTDKGERLDESGVALPANYGPFGPAWKPVRVAEIYVEGYAGLVARDGDAALFDDLRRATLFPLPQGERGVGFEVLRQDAEPTRDADRTFGNDSTPLLARAKRAAVHADLDADGREEVVSARLEGGRLLATVLEDSKQGHARSEIVLLEATDAKGVALAAMDLDGTARQAVVIATEGAASITLRFAERDAEGWRMRADLEKQLPLNVGRDAARHGAFVEMAAGNLDRDGGDELAVVINEIHVDLGGDETASAAWYAFDDAATGLAALVEGRPVTGAAFRLPSDPDADADAVSEVMAEYRAVFADVVIADFDQDSVGEIAFAGLRDMGAHDAASLESEENPFDDGRRRHLAQYVLMIRDGLSHAQDGEVSGFAPLGAKAIDHYWHDGQSDTRDEWNRQRYTVQANALNADGGNSVEIQLNQYVLSMQQPASGRLEFFDDEFQALGTLDDTDLMDPRVGASHFSAAVAAVRTGDVTGDGRDDIVVAHENGRRVAIYSVLAARNHAVALNGTILREETAIQDHQAQASYPVLMLPDSDHDSVTLRYTPRPKKLVFTEPVVHAVLAAAPGRYDIGQRLDLNETGFGQATGRSDEKTFGASVSASAWVGGKVKAPLGLFEVEVKRTMSTSLQTLKSKRYTKTEEVTRLNVADRNGRLRNLVIFTTLPVDIYEYEIVAHPDQGEVGKVITVALPRKPVTTQVSLEDYNAAVVGRKPDLDAVLPRPGDLSSYPSAGRKDTLIGGGRGIAMSQPIDVSTSGGIVQTLSIEKAKASAETLNVDTEYSVEVTAGGAVGGFSVGAGVERGLRVETSHSSTFTGKVGAIEGGSLGDARDNAFHWGLFTYVHRDSDTKQEFQVVTYWVE